MLLLNLSHYVKKTDSSTEETEDEEGKVKALDPFSKFWSNILLTNKIKLILSNVQILFVKLCLAEVDAYRVNASGCDILDYASSSDSDIEPTTVTDTLRGSYLDDSDNESLYSAQEDPLK